MPLRLAFGLDGVLADLDGTLARHADALFGPIDTRSPSESEAQHRLLWQHAASIPDFWETLAETEPGIVKRLAALSQVHRWEPIFLTTRRDTAGSTPQRQTQRWLEAHGFPLPAVYVAHGSR